MKGQLLGEVSEEQAGLLCSCLFLGGPGRDMSSGWEVPLCAQDLLSPWGECEPWDEAGEQGWLPAVSRSGDPGYMEGKNQLGRGSPGFELRGGSSPLPSGPLAPSGVSWGLVALTEEGRAMSSLLPQGQKNQRHHPS